MAKLLALASTTMLFAACGKKDDAPASSTNRPTHRRSGSRVTEKGFEPENVDAPAGKPVTLVFTRKTDKTCATEVILTMDDGKKIEKSLLDTPVELAATFRRPASSDTPAGWI